MNYLNLMDFVILNFLTNKSNLHINLFYFKFPSNMYVIFLFLIRYFWKSVNFFQFWMILNKNWLFNQWNYFKKYWKFKIAFDIYLRFFLISELLMCKTLFVFMLQKEIRCLCNQWNMIRVWKIFKFLNFD
jgi:hypothetical protein